MVATLRFPGSCANLRLLTVSGKQVPLPWLSLQLRFQTSFDFHQSRCPADILCSDLQYLLLWHASRFDRCPPL